MFVKSKHARSVTRATLLRAVFYVYVYPKNGFLNKLRERFGSSVRLLLNSELALQIVLKNLPDRQPGMVVGIESRNTRRYAKIIERQGLKVVEFEGEKSLIDLLESSHILAVIVPDSYDAMGARKKNRFDKSAPIKIIYQNRKRPRPVDLVHDIYMWEPKALPRTVCGCVVAVPNDKLSQIIEQLKKANMSRPRFLANNFIREIYWATKGFENKYRRVDKSPPRVLARMLYDFYK